MAAVTVAPDDRRVVKTVPGLPASDYCDPDRFALELDRIHARSWVFVGLTDGLGQPNDFITAEIAGRAIVVQNFDGELRAFQNVCRHRFARIQRQGCGNRRLECPYHGWLYNRDGVPVGIPGNDQWFGLDREGKKQLALTRYQVATCGRFVFVRQHPGGPGLEEYLGPLAVLLRSLDILDQPVASGGERWRANWKIGVESVLEPYHVSATHPETFKPFISGQWVSETADPHSRCLADFSEGSAKWWSGIKRALTLESVPGLRDYDHYFVFPNLSLAVTAGSFLSVQSYDPVSAGELDLSYRLFFARSRKPAGAAMRTVADQLIGFNQRVLAEDRRECESVQRGVAEMGRAAALLGGAEDRIAAFHHACMACTDPVPENG